MPYPKCVKIYQSSLRSGSINVKGYKHAAVPIIAASILLPQSYIILDNIPNIADTVILANIIRQLGGEISFINDQLKINTFAVNEHIVPFNLSQQIHGAIYLLPTLLARFQKVILGKCGGCQIGNDISLGSKRPINHMISVLSKFGAEFTEQDNAIVGTAKDFHACVIDIMDYSDKRNDINGPLVSGATKTAILSAMAVKKGTTTILNPYFKPDVTELLEFLKLAGYKIEFEKKVINISNNNAINDINYRIMSDISEIMTYITCAAYHNIPRLALNNLTVEKVKIGLKSELDYLDKLNINLAWGKDNLIVNTNNNEIRSHDIFVTSTSIYSDHQPMFSLLLSIADNSSEVIDEVWHNRFSYTAELKKLGLKLELENNKLTIYPSYPHIGKQFLTASDLRAAAILFIAALKAPNYTIIDHIDHLYRGHEDFIGELKKLGATIEIIESEKYINKAMILSGQT